MQFGRSRTPNKNDLDSSPSKDRSLSPIRSPPKVDSVSEIDPEVVRVALRDFAQKLRDYERERDEALAQVNSLQRQFAEVENDRNECERRVQTLQKALQESENGIFYSFALYTF